MRGILAEHRARRRLPSCPLPSSPFVVVTKMSHEPKDATHMRYALLINELPGTYDGLGPEERQALTAEYFAIRDDPRVVDGGRLQPAATATTVRVDDGRTLLTDGPFAATKEVFGGWFLLEADDLDAAIEIAERIPATRMGGSVEIRALVEYAR
jgi:hypothetical protein